MVRKVLLICGVLSSPLYLAADVYAWSQYPGYSPVFQAFSELLAEGAPTRPLMVAVAGAPYNLLVVALGAGVWASSGRARVAHITRPLLVLYAVISYLGGMVFQLGEPGPEGAARIVLSNRRGGPEGVIDLIEARAPMALTTSTPSPATPSARPSCAATPHLQGTPRAR